MNEPERARLSVRFFLDRLRDQVSTLRSHSFPGDQRGPLLWLELADGILDTAGTYLDGAETSTPDDALKLTRDAAALCSVAYDHLGHLSGATADHIPWAVVDPLKRWFEELKIDNTVFFRAAVERNYEIKPFDSGEFTRFRNISESLRKAINAANWPILRVTVPSAALSILPHFAIVAHEVGHRIPVPLNTSLLQPVVDPAIQRMQAQLGNLDQETIVRFQEVIFRWSAEFCSDAVAFFLTGPASFFSLDFTQLAAMGYHGASRSHPAHEVRRAAMFSRLKTGSPSFADVFETLTGSPLTDEMGSSLLVKVKDKATLRADMFARYADQKLSVVIAELHEVAPALADLIYSQVESYLRANAPDSIYSTINYKSDLDHPLSALVLTIPPVEVGDEIGSKTASTFASILNIGWAAVHTQLDQIRVRTDPEHPKTGKLAAVHGLLLKAVELSEAKRRWVRASSK